jgi:hypothetical protein
LWRRSGAHIRNACTTDLKGIPMPDHVLIGVFALAAILILVITVTVLLRDQGFDLSLGGHRFHLSLKTEGKQKSPELERET